MIKARNEEEKTQAFTLMMKVLDHNVKTGKAKAKELLDAHEQFMKYSEQMDKEAMERKDKILADVQKDRKK